ncbi:ASCH domain-containing protein [Roseobacter sinensis]|uniref:ASCH domain-containing protein n=1 Tax=Roseobacter sinensis TaxID=2931391 RepID=A0ABT3BKW7_9RHOB|nr:ASCH domain-containing protein [Roseobacter sp. WL0113]MCV3274212.1 ASCH domain-containing protein [Roseobacter sp. WL0113]
MAKRIQTLGVVDRLFPQVLSGEKRSTIRWKENQITIGPLRFVCDGDQQQTVDVEVFRCTHMPLSEVASFVGKTDEWPDQIMLEGMREHYPEIKLSSIVQVIEYRVP